MDIQQLSDNKHENQKELQKLKLEIDRLLDRSVKLHQREFEVLPKLWELAVEAFELTRINVSDGQLVENFDELDDTTRRKSLEFLGAEQWQIDQALTSKEPETEFYRLYSAVRGARAQAALGQFYKYRKTNGIFLQASLMTDFEAFDELIYNAFFEQQRDFRRPGSFEDRNQRDRFDSEAKSLLKALEKKVHNRLWS